MPHTKHGSNRKRRNETLPALGVVGMSLSLAGGTSDATAAPVPDTFSPQAAPGHEFNLNEEEVADVSLATFYVFDKENAGKPQVQLAGGCRCGCRCGCRGCRGCRCGCGGCGGCGCCPWWICGCAC